MPNGALTTYAPSMISAFGAGAAGACAALPWLANGRVLLVDDEPFALERMAAVLRRLAGPGLELVTAGGFEGALDASGEHGGAFDLVLANYMLWPGDASGLELLPALLRAGLTASARTVLFSITMDQRLRRRALACGFDDTLLTEDIDAAVVGALLGRLGRG